MKLAFLSSKSPEAIAARETLLEHYTDNSTDDADVIIALGGDGFMLQTQHEFMNSGKKVFGMNKGTVGFLMNEYRVAGLMERIEKSEDNIIHPLDMVATDKNGDVHRAKAMNEVSLLRQSYQAASLKIIIDDKVRLESLVCDGAMVASPAGSTAYNLSANGPILPLDAPLLALTPVSAFRPRRWRGALLSNRANVEIVINEPEKRPVNAVADHVEIKSVTNVKIREDRTTSGILLFDPEHSWDERILAEQFMH